MVFIPSKMSETFSIQNESDYTRNFKTVTFDIKDVQTVDFVLSQFADWRGMAHAFVTFGIQRSSHMEYIAISVEIRKEIDEEYSPIKGMLKQYELAYVIATETDVIQLRTNHRNEPVYLYPMDVSPDYAQALLISMLSQAHHWKVFQSSTTMTNSCMSNLAKHVNNVKPGLIPLWLQTLYSPDFQTILYRRLGLLSSNTNDIGEISKNHQINE